MSLSPSTKKVLTSGDRSAQDDAICSESGLIEEMHRRFGGLLSRPYGSVTIKKHQNLVDIEDTTRIRFRIT